MIKHWPKDKVIAHLTFEDARRITRNIDIDPRELPGDWILAHYDAIMDDSGGLRREASKNNRGLGGNILEMVVSDCLIQAGACGEEELDFNVRPFEYSREDVDILAKGVIGVHCKTSFKERWKHIGYSAIDLARLEQQFGGLIYEKHGDSLDKGIAKARRANEGRIPPDPTEYGCFADNEFVCKIVKTIRDA